MGVRYGLFLLDILVRVLCFSDSFSMRLGYV